MEKRIGGASVFALFSSRASLTSKWVAFEIDRARLNHINPHPLDDALTCGARTAIQLT
jgi:hypothetical protein